MATLNLIDLDDATAQQLRTQGWVIKSPFFISGRAVFPAFHKAG